MLGPSPTNHRRKKEPRVPKASARKSRVAKEASRADRSRRDAKKVRALVKAKGRAKGSVLGKDRARAKVRVRKGAGRKKETNRRAGKASAATRDKDNRASISPAAVRKVLDPANRKVRIRTKGECKVRVNRARAVPTSIRRIWNG